MLYETFVTDILVLLLFHEYLLILIHYELITLYTNENGLLFSLLMILGCRQISDLLIQKLLSFIVGWRRGDRVMLRDYDGALG
jgi:hypothetical protein